MTNKRNNKKSVPAQEATGIKLVRYTKKVWLDSYPESNAEEWKMVEHPNCLSEFINDQIADGILETSNPDQVITIVTLDGEYLEWLKKNHRQNTSQNRIEYALSINDENATRLMRKNAMHRDDFVKAVPIILGFTPWGGGGRLVSDYFIEASTCRKLEKEISKMCLNDAVKVPGTIVKASEFHHYETEIWEDVMFDHIDRDDEMWWSVQDYDSPMAPYAVLFIPFLQIRKQQSATFTMREYLDTPRFEIMRGEKGYVPKVMEEAAKNIGQILANDFVFDSETVAGVPTVTNSYFARTLEREILAELYQDFYSEYGFEDENIDEAKMNVNSDPKMRA